VPIVKTNVVKARCFISSVRYDNVRTLIAIEINNGDIAGGPLLISECAREGEVRFSIVEIDDLFIWSIVTNNHIEVTITIQIGNRSGVGSIGSLAESVSSIEMSK